MRKNLYTLMTILAFSFGTALNSGCNVINGGDGTSGGGGGGGGDGGDGGDGGGGGGGGDLLSFVLTNIAVHTQGRIAAGNDIIAYTAADPSDRTANGVDFIIPSANDTAGRGIPNGTEYDDDSFAVAGKKIALVGGPTDTFQVSIFDTATDTLSAVPINEIRLANIPVDNYDAGHIQADGNYVVTRNDPGQVDDGAIVKVIDISGATPQVISFSNNPGGATSGFQVPMVMVDNETKLVAAVKGSSFFVYDIDNPTTAPTEFDVSGSGGLQNDNQLAFDNGVILYADDDDVVHYLDVTQSTNNLATIASPDTNTIWKYALAGANYGFLYSGPASSGSVAAVATIPNLTPPVPDMNNTVASNTANLGTFGYGETIAIATHGGATVWFLGGEDRIATPQPLQYSTGNGTWVVTPDPADPENNLKGSDVATNVEGNLLGFKHGTDTDTFLGYSILD